MSKKNKNLTIAITDKSTKRNILGWYASGVDMRFSFQSLESIGEQLGANFKHGDILVVDNKNGDRRKVFKKVQEGFIMLYAYIISGNKFIPMTDSNGKIGSAKALPHYFEF